MCGRFEAKFKIPFKKSIWEILGIPAPTAEDYELPYKQKDVRPTNNILVIRKNGDDFIYDLMKWGINVPLAGDKIFLMINSKIENIKTKTMWKSALDKSPCLIPMTGFYEWLTEGKNKIPHKFTIKEQPIFFAAGYYRNGKDKEGNPIRETTIITTEGNDITRPIHPKDRSPVILKPECVADYMNGDINFRMSVCEPYPESEMEVVEEAP